MSTAFLEAGTSPFAYVLGHNVDEVLFSPLGITKFTLNMMVSALLLITLVMLSNRRSATPKGKLRGLFESTYLFIRDEMVYPSIGRHLGGRFMPFFMTIFLFILTMNLVGLVPLPVIGGAATSQLSLTLPLALIVIAVSIIGGLVVNGAGGFLGTFVPSGLPMAVVPLIFVLEVIGFLIKHGVLAVRLMANMLGGHLVVGSFIALIALFQSYGIALFSVPMVVFVNLLEVLVAFLQAYVFTLLAVLFIGSTVHPDH